jgi:hypothetical protein
MVIQADAPEEERAQINIQHITRSVLAVTV